jgi:DNA-binding NarL/FixJ family response regulator
MQPRSVSPRLRNSSNRFAVVDEQVRDDPPSAAAAPAIAVLLAHGEALARAGLRALLEQQSDILVMDEAADGGEALALAQRMRPDVVLIDRRLPGLDWLDATRGILADPSLAATRVLILSSSESDDELLGALRAGASGILVGDTDPVELVQTLRAVAGGEALLSPRVTRRLLDAFAAHPDPHRAVPQPFDELTAREREVMTLVAMGLTNAEVAERLVVTRATAKTHVNRTMMKLHARDRAKLVALAYQAGFVEPRPRLTEVGHGAQRSAAPTPVRRAA